MVSRFEIWKSKFIDGLTLFAAWVIIVLLLGGTFLFIIRIIYQVVR